MIENDRLIKLKSGDIGEFFVSEHAFYDWFLRQPKKGDTVLVFEGKRLFFPERIKRKILKEIQQGTFIKNFNTIFYIVMCHYARVTGKYIQV